MDQVALTDLVPFTVSNYGILVGSPPAGSRGRRYAGTRGVTPGPPVKEGTIGQSQLVS